MIALLAIILGGLAVGYAAWSSFMGRAAAALPEAHTELKTPDEARAEAAGLKAWSVAAGEIAGDEPAREENDE